MTEVITRSPLAALSMASSQRQTRRRSAENAFQEDNGPPTKKTKVDDKSDDAARSLNRAKAPQKKDKGAYDEDADGFQFSRARSKKKPQKLPAADASEAKATVTKSPTGKSRKKSIERTEPSEKSKHPTRRRSARLSGEKTQAPEPPVPISASPGNARKAKTGAEAPEPVRETTTAEHVANVETRAKTPQPDRVVVEKQRRATKIALPFADTPVIQRNKEMRKGSSETRRRSSSSLRGRRASSLMDNGTSNAVPHREVEASEFYKHISQDLPELRRMKQLLVWCGSRALPAKPTGSSKDVNAILAARVVQEELLKDFSNKSEMSDWFNREDIAPTSLTKRPNPRNQENLKRLQELEQEVKRLEGEKAGWDSLLGSLNSMLDSEPGSLHIDSSRPVDSKDINPTGLGDEDQALLLASLNTRSDMFTDAKSRLADLTASLEFKIDSLADGAHKLEKFKESIDDVAKQTVTKATSMLEQRQKERVERSGMGNVGVGDVLRTLSRLHD